jgi:hypothetical protein
MKRQRDNYGQKSSVYVMSKKTRHLQIYVHTYVPT